MTSYPVVFLAEEVKYLKRGFWGAVGVYHWDTQTLGCLLVGVQAVLTDRRHRWALAPRPGTSQLVGHLPPQLLLEVAHLMRSPLLSRFPLCIYL